jgi:hypothetical protein
MVPLAAAQGGKIAARNAAVEGTGSVPGGKAAGNAGEARSDPWGRAGVWGFRTQGKKVPFACFEGVGFGFVAHRETPGCSQLVACAEWVAR